MQDRIQRLGVHLLRSLQSRAIALRITDPIATPDLIAVVRTCLRAYEDHRDEPTKGYNYKTETIVNKLAIMLEEQRQLKTLIGKDVKYERKNAKRREDGLTKRERTSKENLNNVSELLKHGLKQKEIAEKLGLIDFCNCFQPFIYPMKKLDSSRV